MARTVCKVTGVFFLITAGWGFAHGEQVLLFHVNTAQNLLHLCTGLAALFFGFREELTARTCAAALAAIYGIIGGLGILGAEPVIDGLNLNTAGNWLHVLSGLIFFAAAFGDQLGILRIFSTPESVPPSSRLQH